MLWVLYAIISAVMAFCLLALCLLALCLLAVRSALCALTDTRMPDSNEDVRVYMYAL